MVAQQLEFICKVTNQDCPRDKTSKLVEIVTTIGARHQKEASSSEAAAKLGASAGQSAAPADEDDGEQEDEDA